MDPILTAHMKVVAASGEGKQDSARRGGSSYEQGKLRDERRLRGSLSFLDRMETDAKNKEAFTQVSTMRKNPMHKDALDRAVNKMRPAKELTGPKVVTHGSKILYEGQD